MAITREDWGISDNKKVNLFTLTNKNNMTVKIIDYGGIITEIIIPDKNGKLIDIALGFDKLDNYLKAHPYLGATIGRFGNRIANGRFSIDGKEYKLACNDGDNHLHGGEKGFDKIVWDSEIQGNTLKLSYFSKDMEEGYPGNMNVEVSFSLTDDNELVIDYIADTDKKTILNLTNHSYFNLNGEGDSNDILKHSLKLNCNQYTETDSGSIPTGVISDTLGTPLDFSSLTELGSRINSDFEQMVFAGGYDHNFIINGNTDSLRLAAELQGDISGILMQVLTTEPAIQIYTGNYLDGSVTGKAGKAYTKRSGICLETQHYPDSPNHAAFPTTELEPGKQFKSTTIYKFSC
jgi:aldose 1-epimerase